MTIGFKIFSPFLSKHYTLSDNIDSNFQTDQPGNGVKSQIPGI